MVGEETFFKYFTIEKVYTEERIVEGFASAPTVDGQDDIVDPQGMEKAIPDYMRWANLREMHGNNAAGKVLAMRVLKNGKTWIRAKIVDDAAWEKVKEGVYKGFSIGGKALKTVMEKLSNGQTARRILELALTEVSLVDRPANPEATITLWKGMNMENLLDLAAKDEEVITKSEAASGVGGETQETPQTIEKAAAPDPMKIVQEIQALRNQYELDGNTDAAQMLTEAIGQMLSASQDQSADENGGDGDGDPIEGGEGESAEGQEADQPVGEMAPEDAANVASMQKDDDEGGDVAMAAKILDLAKRGATFNKENAGKLGTIHGHAQEIAKICKAMMAPPAAPGQEQPGAPMQGKAAKATTLAKAFSAQPIQKLDDAVAKAIAPHFEKFAGLFENLNKRLEALENKPVGGGPVVSGAVNKSFAGAQGGQEQGNSLEDLQKAMAEETNPFKKAAIGEAIARIQARQVYGFR